MNVHPLVFRLTEEVPMDCQFCHQTFEEILVSNVDLKTCGCYACLKERKLIKEEHAAAA